MIWIAVAIVAVVGLTVAAWIFSGPRFQRGYDSERPQRDYTQGEQNALLGVHGLGQPGGASRGPK